MSHELSNERSYRVLAHEFRLTSSPRSLRDFLHRFLAPFEAEVGPGASRYELRREPGHAEPWVVAVDGRPRQRAVTPERILEFALWDISTSGIGSDHGFLAIHAAAASWRGAGVVLPAPPESGKSTLVAGLTRAGCSYLTDEASLIDPVTGLLHPFPRSLWLDRRSVEAVFGGAPPGAPWRTGRQFHIRPSDLRVDAVGPPCPVRMVVAPSYEAGSATTLEPIGRAEAVTILARNVFHLDRFGARAIEVLARVVREARCYRIRIGDLDEAVGAILDAVRSRG